MTIQDIIKKLANTGLEMYCKVCTVDSVDETARTVDCTPIDEGAPLLGVNLQANQNSEVGDIAFPSVGSFVVVAFLSPMVAVVVLCDKVEKRLLTIGDTEITTTADGVIMNVDKTEVKITAGSVVINGGDLGGMVKVEDITKKINAVEARCDTLLSTLQGVIIPLAPTGTVLFAPMFIMKPLGTTLQSELENIKVKH